MALAWKVMLPLGLLNFVAVALLDELQKWFLEPRLGEALSSWLMVLPAALVCGAAWLVVGMLAPRVSDSRPRATGSRAVAEI
jgi:NADH-quinone oxidoreductase subunit H